MTSTRPHSRVLDRFLAACAARPATAAAGTVAYVVWVATTHDHVQDLAYWLQATFGRALWAPTVAVLGAAAFALACRAAYRRIAVSAVRTEAAGAWWGTAALLVASFLTLLATNMESVHFVQYAIPAVPVLALTRRFSVTVLVVTALGAADEWWQFDVLHRHWAVPWDMNDIVLNAIGASLGCASILVFADLVRVRDVRRAFVAPVSAAVLVGGGALALLGAGVIGLHPEDGPAAVLLSRSERPPERWTSPEWGRGHYQIHPAGTLAVCLALAFAFAWIDTRAAWRRAEESP